MDLHDGHLTNDEFISSLDFTDIDEINVTCDYLSLKELFNLVVLVSKHKIKKLSLPSTLPTYEVLYLGTPACYRISEYPKIELDEFVINYHGQADSQFGFLTYLIQSKQVKTVKIDCNTVLKYETDIAKCIGFICNVNVIGQPLSPLLKPPKLKCIEDVMDRNLIGLKKCRDAALYPLLMRMCDSIFRRTPKDVVIIICKIVWNTRETKIWF